MTTHVLQVVDASGSMNPLADDVRGGVNAYHRSLATDLPDCRVTLATFDGDVTVVCADTPIGEVPDLTTTTYQAVGTTTALFDAVGQVVTEFAGRVPLLPDGDRALLVISTDGKDNASHLYTSTAIRTVITALEQTGRWQIVMVMTGADEWSQAHDMGLTRSGYAHIPATAGATRRAYPNLTSYTVGYAANGPSASAGADIAAGTAD